MPFLFLPMLVNVEIWLSASVLGLGLLLYRCSYSVTTTLKTLNVQKGTQISIL